MISNFRLQKKGLLTRNLAVIIKLEFIFYFLRINAGNFIQITERLEVTKKEMYDEIESIQTIKQKL